MKKKEEVRFSQREILNQDETKPQPKKKKPSKKDEAKYDIRYIDGVKHMTLKNNI